MRRRAFLSGALASLGAPLGAEAQPAGKVARIGLLATTPPPPYMWAALVEGLRGRGWVEGRNILFEQRFSEGTARINSSSNAQPAAGVLREVPDGVEWGSAPGKC
jgi:hypothetical protein